VYFVTNKILCCRRSKKVQLQDRLLRTAEESLADQLDIIGILRKLQEIDRLKAILLDDKQLKLFNSVHKTELLVNQNSSIGNRYLTMYLVWSLNATN
jgi:hypothetical protein